VPHTFNNYRLAPQLQLLYMYSDKGITATCMCALSTAAGRDAGQETVSSNCGLPLRVCSKQLS
jgi:hypothetical protein